MNKSNATGSFYIAALKIDPNELCRWFIIVHLQHWRVLANNLYRTILNNNRRFLCKLLPKKYRYGFRRDY